MMQKYQVYRKSTNELLRTGEISEGGVVEFDPIFEFVRLPRRDGTTTIMTGSGTMNIKDDFASINPFHQRREFFIKEGFKADESKNRLDLIPPEALQRVGEVYTYGSRKYADHNWRKGLKYSRLYGATLRHLFAFWTGEDNDKESKLPHLAHATFGLLGLLQYQEEGRRQLDDRFVWPKGATETQCCGREETEKPVREVGCEGTPEDLVAKSRVWHPEFGFASVI
jgi:hypothetical protein